MKLPQIRKIGYNAHRLYRSLKAMLRDEILDKLRADKAALDGFGVRSIGVFGSVARGDETPDSDVDIAVDYDKKITVGLFGFIEMREHLESILGREVDLVMSDALHPELKDGILKETVYA